MLITLLANNKSHQPLCVNSVLFDILLDFSSVSSFYTALVSHLRLMFHIIVLVFSFYCMPCSLLFHFMVSPKSLQRQPDVPSA